ncbi:MAG: UMP kinase [Saprospiraceae bacterium]|jgi:uridylate kinase|nr:UMP kinase [Saprospiraceae bacterium]MBK8298102.1 UMP kinase [Saprospiraceae bacterium]
MPKYKRILLKLSGEALMGDQAYGIEPQMLKYYASQIKMAVSHQIELAVVIGGGNIFRGMDGEGSGIERVQGDYMGMLATCINGMALQSALELIGVYTRLITAIEMRQIAEPYIRRRAVRHLEKGRVIIFAAGTGNPYFTTDSAAALRASELNVDVILKGTRVDGIYDKDPMKHTDAIKFERLGFDEVISRGLQVMDMTAFTMCKENHMPIVVFDINQSSNFERIILGEHVGTLVS